MAARISRLVLAGSCAVRIGPCAAWPRRTGAVQLRCFMPIAPSRAFSASVAASQAEGVDMSSTVTKMRDFALMHGISLKGLRLKADIFAAIQMHFGVFVKVHAGAHSAGLELQGETMVAAAPVEDEAVDERLNVQLPFAALMLETIIVPANAHHAYTFFVRRSITSSLKTRPRLRRWSRCGAFCPRQSSATCKRSLKHRPCPTGMMLVLLF